MPRWPSAARPGCAASFSVDSAGASPPNPAAPPIGSRVASRHGRRSRRSACASAGHDPHPRWAPSAAAAARWYAEHGLTAAGRTADDGDREDVPAARRLGTRVGSARRAAPRSAGSAPDRGGGIAARRGHVGPRHGHERRPTPSSAPIRLPRPAPSTPGSTPSRQSTVPRPACARRLRPSSTRGRCRGPCR